MQLSDGTIRKLLGSEIRIDPEPAEHCFQPATVDLTLGTSFRFPRGSGVITNNAFQIRPKGFVLACTRERVSISSGLAAQVKGKSTNAREGLMVECAGFVDPNFGGHITLELFNMSDEYIRVEAGMSIAQIAFYRLDEPALRPYGHEGLNSHYQGQRGATAARRG